MKSYRWILTLLLIAAIGYECAVIATCCIKEKYITPPRMTITDKKTPQQTETQSVDCYLKNVRALFPPPAEAMTRAQSSEESSSPTDITLQLSSTKLVATIIGNQHSLAVIKDGDTERTVTVGQSICGFRVKRISADKVTMTDGTHDAQLWIGGREPEISKTANSQTNRNDPDSLVPSLIKIEMSRQEFNRRTETPERKFGPVPFNTYYRNGKPIGLKIVYITKESLLADLGFCHGDILLGFNGNKISTPEDGFTVYQSLKNNDFTDFEIERRGKICHLQIEFR